MTSSPAHFLKYLGAITTTIVFVFLSVQISYAVTVEPGPVCDISATVLNVEKTRTNIAGLGYPPRKDFDYYAVELSVHISTVYQDTGVGSCASLNNTKQNVIIQTHEYDKFPIAIGQYIKGRVQYRGDEWFNGYFLFDMAALGILRNLGVGSTGIDVTLLQIKLQELGYFATKTKTTKYFGLITKHAVQLFQKANNISLTGFVGPLTRAALLRSFTSSLQCLPPDITVNDVTNATPDLNHTDPLTGVPLVNKTTVKEKMSQLGAHCDEQSRLLNSAGKGIIFYHLSGCWVPPLPYNAEEILNTQRAEITELNKIYDVVEMTCNPSGLPLAP